MQLFLNVAPAESNSVDNPPPLSERKVSKRKREEEKPIPDPISVRHPNKKRGLDLQTDVHSMDFSEVKEQKLPAVKKPIIQHNFIEDNQAPSHTFKIISPWAIFSFSINESALDYYSDFTGSAGFWLFSNTGIIDSSVIDPFDFKKILEFVSFIYKYRDGSKKISPRFFAKEIKGFDFDYLLRLIRTCKKFNCTFIINHIENLLKSKRTFINKKNVLNVLRLVFLLRKENRIQLNILFDACLNILMKNGLKVLNYEDQACDISFFESKGMTISYEMAKFDDFLKDFSKNKIVPFPFKVVIDDRQEKNFLNKGLFVKSKFRKKVSHLFPNVKKIKINFTETIVGYFPNNFRDDFRSLVGLDVYLPPYGIFESYKERLKGFDFSLLEGARLKLDRKIKNKRYNLIELMALFPSFFESLLSKATWIRKRGICIGDEMLKEFLNCYPETFLHLPNLKKIELTNLTNESLIKIIRFNPQLEEVELKLEISNTKILQYLKNLPILKKVIINLPGNDYAVHEYVNLIRNYFIEKIGSLELIFCSDLLPKCGVA